MADKITVAEELSDWGQQVFAFKLPNGRTLELTFCQHLIDPDGDPCCHQAVLFDQNGEKIGIAVNDPTGESGAHEKKMMNHPALWFSTPEEDERHSQTVSHELNQLKEELAPVMEEIEKRTQHKNN